MTDQAKGKRRKQANGVVWASSAKDAARLLETVASESLPLALNTVSSLRELIQLSAEQPVDFIVVWQSVVANDASVQSYLHDWLGFREQASGILVAPHPTPSEFLLAAELGLMDVVDQRNTVQLLFAIRRELVALAIRRKLRHLVKEYEERFIIDKDDVLDGTELPGIEPLVIDIEHALKHDGFELEFQPIMPMSDDGMDNFEVLIRLKRGESERISAKRFLPVAERYGLMSAVDRWVVRNTLQRFDHEAKSASPGARPLRFFVNIASVSLMDTAIIGQLLSTVTRYGAPPGSIVIEVPKQVAEAQLDHVKSLNASAQKFGVGFALDGYEASDTSRNYLRHLAVDYLKISGERLRGIESDEKLQRELKTIVDFAHQKSLQVIANHVDSLDTLAYLASSGVDYLEGFAVSEPTDEPARGFFNTSDFL